MAQQGKQRCACLWRRGSCSPLPILRCPAPLPNCTLLFPTTSVPCPLPASLFVQIVAAFPVTSAGLPWVRASRAWRRGIRAALITDFQPSPELVAEGAAHGEAFLFFNSSGVPFENFGKAGELRVAWEGLQASGGDDLHMCVARPQRAAHGFRKVAGLLPTGAS